MREPYSAFLNGEINLDQFYDMFKTKVYPVTDDNPYFLSFEKPLPSAVEILLYASIGIVAIFLLVPFSWIRRGRGIARGGGGGQTEINSEKSELRIAAVITLFCSPWRRLYLDRVGAPAKTHSFDGQSYNDFCAIVVYPAFIKRVR